MCTCMHGPNVLTLSDALTCYDLSVPLPETRICFAVITTSLGSQWGMTTEDEITPAVKCESVFSTCVVWGNVSGSWSGRWDPQVTLKLVLIQWLASVEQDQINSSIQGTLQILNRSLDTIVEFLTLLCWCESGVLLSPWWPCDGPWATERRQ